MAIFKTPATDSPAAPDHPGHTKLRYAAPASSHALRACSSPSQATYIIT